MCMCLCVVFKTRPTKQLMGAFLSAGRGWDGTCYILVDTVAVVGTN